MNKLSVLIPALNPNDRLFSLVTELITEKGVTGPVVIVNDGSDASHKKIFEDIACIQDEKIVILTHFSNQGKGAAIKTGLKYILDTFPHVSGIATLDADGQHKIQDLIKCIELFQKVNKNLVLGVRTFGAEVPLRSRLGNILTAKIMKKFTGNTITDTQTGLRVIPSYYAQELVKFGENRFDFEFKMLLLSKKYHVEINELPIQTIYIDGNQSSHFRVIQDSISIYSQFIKFAISGIVSSLVDILVFSVIIFLAQNSSLKMILFATIIARVLSSIVNYNLNKYSVFKKIETKYALRYLILVAGQLYFSGLMTYCIAHLFWISDAPQVAAFSKIGSDTILFFISYQIQKRYIFNENIQ